MSQTFRRLRAGEVPDPDDWNDVVTYLEQLLTTGGGGDVWLSLGRDGLVVTDHRPQGHWARIVSVFDGSGSGSDGGSGDGPPPGPNLYAHVPVDVQETGEVPEVPEHPGRLEGTRTDLPAIEVNGRSDVPFGTVAWLEPSRVGPWFEFTAPVGGASGSGSGGGPKSGSGSGGQNPCCVTVDDRTYACVDDTLVATVATYEICLVNGCLVKTRVA